MAKTQYKDGGDVNYAKDVTDFVKRNQTNKKVTDLSIKDVPAVAKEFGATAAGLAALPFADISSSAVNAYRRRDAKNEEKKAREAEAELKRESSRGMKKGGAVSASKRADGIAQRGRTRGQMR